MKKTYIVSALTLTSILFVNAQDAPKGVMVTKDLQKGAPTSVKMMDSRGMQGQGEAGKMMAPVQMTTGDPAVDAQLKALSQEMDAKIRALQKEYAEKVKAIIGNKVLRPTGVPGSNGVGPSGAGAPGINVRDDNGSKDKSEGGDDTGRPTPPARGLLRQPSDNSGRNVLQGVPQKMNTEGQDQPTGMFGGFFKGLFGGDR